MTTFALPPFAMEHNLVLQAGAGTGKTHALVTLALHQLAGASARRRPVPAPRLVALTFTEKAGAEMRERLQQRLGALADGRPMAEAEPDLARTFSLLGLTVPKRETWQRLRRDVSLASIGTFHSFCAAQLRRLAPNAGLDPAFAVLDEEEARALFEEALSGHVHAALADRDPEARALVDEFELGTLEGLVRAVLGRLSEDGRDASALADPRFDDAFAAARLREGLARIRAAVAGFGAMSEKVLARIAPARTQLETALETFLPATAESAFDALRRARKAFRKPTGSDGVPVTAFDEALESFEQAWAGVRAAPLGRAFISVAAAVETRFREAKRAAEALDFSDLQRVLRDVLLYDHAARGELKERIDALLVDEFQDTSRLQLDLVALLAEARGREASLSPDEVAAQVAWEPGLLCVVGDRKQSIYEFRGADVAVFSGLETALARATEPLRIERLTRSYRSRPALVRLVNALFGKVMTAAAEPFDVAFGPGDALEPAAAEESALAEVKAELLEAAGDVAAEQRADEARRIAERISRLLHDPDERVRVRDRAVGLRRVEGRDVAILFRRLTQLDVYRRALAERGLPHVVVGGGGFYESLEVLDGWMLLRALADPGDVVASVAVLRSPFCAVTDASLALLALEGEGTETRARPLSLRRLLRARALLARLPEAERLRVDALLDVVSLVGPELDRLGLARSLVLALEALDYLAVSAALPEADAVAANLDKLRRILEDLDARGPTARAALLELTSRIETKRREPGAAVSEESDPRAIRLMSVHQSKGLEFPVVFIADAGAADPPEAERIALERDRGLGLNVRFADGRLVGMPELSQVRERLAARAQAESLRLLYVAATRAKDHLVFSGAPGTNGSWFELVAALGPEWIDHRVPVELPPPLRHPVETTSALPSIVEDAPKRTRRPVRIEQLTATVTRLQDFADCPERYRLRHEVGLQEHPPAALAEDEDGDDATSPLDVFARGTLAHRLLELADYPDLAGEALHARLAELLAAEGHDAERPEIAEIAEDVQAFLETPFARDLARLPAARRLKELPFLVAVELDEGRRLQVKGQVDLVALSAEGVRIVDYKHSREKADAREVYRFQLASYAAAVREVLGGTDLPVSVGLAFLRERRDDVAMEEIEPGALDAQIARLRELGTRLARCHEENRWPRRERSFCDARACGYRARCFPRTEDAA